MALTTQTVTGTIYYSDGTPMDGAIVSFTLNGTASSVTDPGTVPPNLVNATCNASGEFTTALWPNSLGVGATNYAVTVTYTDSTSGKSLQKILGKVSVPSEGTSYTISELLAAGVVAPTAVYLGVITQAQYDEITTLASDLGDIVAQSSVLLAATETARDAAFVNADVYADTTAGLAAVLDGDQFQVVNGEEIIRYRRDDASTATEVARYFSASFETRHKLLRSSALDRAAGYTWSLADWYLENTSRISTTPWYDVSDKDTLFQDTAGSTPVTAVNDPVRLIKAKSGHFDHDLLILTTGTPATYKERGGVGYVAHGAGISFVSRGDFTFQVPMFVAAGVEKRTTLSNMMFGIMNSNQQYMMVAGTGSGQNRPSLRVRTNGVTNATTTGLSETSGESRHSPRDAPHVMHGGIRVGENFIAVNSLGDVVETGEPWIGTETLGGCKIGTNLNGKTASLNSDYDFYGGWFYFGEPDAELRTNVVEYLRQKIEKPQISTDRNILVVGDSTGDETNETAGVLITGGEWVFRWAQKFATDNPTAYVEIRGFETLLEYRAPIVIQDGTGDVIRIWNNSIAGGQPGEHLGSNLVKGIQDIPLCDTIVINHGYNPQASGAPVISYESQLFGLVEAVKAEHPGAHLFFVRQPRDDSGGTPNGMDAWVDAVDVVSALYGADTIDVWQRYVDYGGTITDLYADGLHPSVLGVDEWIAQVNIDYAAALPLEAHGPGFIDRKKANALVNGEFYDWTAGVPDDWTASGGGVISEVIGDITVGAPVAVQIADTGGSATYIEKAVDATPYQSETVTLTVRQFIDVATADLDSQRGRIEVTTNGTGGATSFVYLNRKWRGGWQWTSAQVDVPADATTVTVRLYGRYDGTGPMTVRYSMASLVSGDKPRRA